MAKKRRKLPLPKLFIGSSSEALPIVAELAAAFGKCATCIPWTSAPEFNERGSSTTFESLCYAAQEYDFALFILTFDDQLIHRRKKYAAPRDNVIFEIGLFIRSIGPDRVFVVVQDATTWPMKIPSDLAGVNMPRFRYSPGSPNSSLASMKSHIHGFVKSIRRKGFRQFQLGLAVKWGFFPETRHYEVRLGGGKLEQSKTAIGNLQICIAGRVDDPCVNFEDDTNVVYSPARPLPTASADMVFRISEPDFVNPLTKDDWIQCKIVLVPTGVTPSQFLNLKEAIAYGCKDVDSCCSLLREELT